MSWLKSPIWKERVMFAYRDEGDEVCELNSLGEKPAYLNNCEQGVVGGFFGF